MSELGREAARVGGDEPPTRRRAIPRTLDPTEVIARLELQVDHVVPVCDGGLHFFANILRCGQVTRYEPAGARLVLVEAADASTPRQVAPLRPEALAVRFLAACQAHDPALEQVRVLAAVVHGLLPQGNHRRDRRIPSGLFSTRDDHGSESTYRCTIEASVREALRDLPELAWAQRVQQPGTPEHRTFTGRLVSVASASPEWFSETLERVWSGGGSQLDRLVVTCAAARLLPAPSTP